MKRKWPWVIGMAFVFLFPIFAHFSRSDAAQALDAQHPMRRVIQTSVLTSGNFVFEGQVELSPQIIGRVTSVYVQEGDAVRVGQPLVQIDPSTYRAARDQQDAGYGIQQQRMMEQRAALRTEHAKFDRIARLAEKGFIARQQLEDAHQALVSAETNLRTSELSINQSKALLDQAKEELGKTKIASPISGFVTSLNIKEGETAVPSTIGIQGAPLITIAKYGSMILELSVGESDVAAIRPGQRVAIHPISYPDRTLEGTVSFISLARRRGDGVAAMQNDSARTYTVKVAFKAPADIALKPSMTCRAEVFVNSSNPVLSVPLQAVFNNNDSTSDEGEASDTVKSYVFVVKNGTAMKQFITLGMSDDNFVEIKSGLQADDVVLTGPYKIVKFLREGEPVTAHIRGAVTR